VRRSGGGDTADDNQVNSSRQPDEQQTNMRAADDGRDRGEPNKIERISLTTDNQQDLQILK